MLCTVSPSVESLHESLSTLHFASRARAVVNTARLAKAAVQLLFFALILVQKLVNMSSIGLCRVHILEIGQHVCLQFLLGGSLR